MLLTIHPYIWTMSIYYDDILHINNFYFDKMVSQIYPLELQPNKVNTSDTKAAFSDLHLSISNDIVSTKIESNVTILILNVLITYFEMVMLFALHPMESISLNSFVLLQNLAMFLTSLSHSQYVVYSETS